MALVGSANLTDAGVQSNQEICVGIDREDARYERLVQIFQAYWDEAKPLDDEALRSFTFLMRQKQDSSEAALDDQIRRTLGDIAPRGIQVGIHKTQDQVYLADYRRVYQEFLHAYREIERIYSASGKRQLPDEVIPLRIEIDSFFSFIREKFASGDSYLAAPLRHGSELDENLRKYIDLWFQERWPYLDDVVPDNYVRIQRALSTPENINATSFDELFGALTVCHSFHETLRFHKGALPALRQDFMRDNDLEKVKRTLTYLLFRPGNFIERMGNCIFNEEYALRWFGRSCVQEVFGWVNGSDIPICNGRTVKSLRFLGFDVRIFT
jgi:hypothetical protein